jgi:hypothetical protein
VSQQQEIFPGPGQYTIEFVSKSSPKYSFGLYEPKTNESASRVGPGSYEVYNDFSTMPSYLKPKTKEKNNSENSISNNASILSVMQSINFFKNQTSKNQNENDD